jgi:glycerol uptake facilitator-like aquaporin
VSRVRLALNVNDIDEAVTFYSKLFGAEPAKRRPGYANFAIAEPPLKLVLLENPGQDGSLNHLGIEVPDTAAIIAMFGPVSGGHFNPVVSFADAAFGGLSWRDASGYLPAQVAGCVGGAAVANLMFAGAAISVSARDRASPAHFLSETVATLGLILLIFALARSGRARSAPAAVGVYIGAAYFFTSSTSFANPAITIVRMFSASFAGIAPASAPSFIAAQVIGGALAVLVIRALYPSVTAAEAADVIVPRHRDHPAPPPGQAADGLRSPAGLRSAAPLPPAPERESLCTWS